MSRPRISNYSVLALRGRPRVEFETDTSDRLIVRIGLSRKPRDDEAALLYERGYKTSEAALLISIEAGDIDDYAVKRWRDDVGDAAGIGLANVQQEHLEDHRRQLILDEVDNKLSRVDFE